MRFRKKPSSPLTVGIISRGVSRSPVYSARSRRQKIQPRPKEGMVMAA